MFNSHNLEYILRARKAAKRNRGIAPKAIPSSPLKGISPDGQDIPFKDCIKSWSQSAMGIYGSYGWGCGRWTWIGIGEGGLSDLMRGDWMNSDVGHRWMQSNWQKGGRRWGDGRGGIWHRGGRGRRMKPTSSIKEASGPENGIYRLQYVWDSETYTEAIGQWRVGNLHDGGLDDFGEENFVVGGCGGGGLYEGSGVVGLQVDPGYGFGELFEEMESVVMSAGSGGGSGGGAGPCVFGDGGWIGRGWAMRGIGPWSGDMILGWVPGCARRCKIGGDTDIRKCEKCYLSGGMGDWKSVDGDGCKEEWYRGVGGVGGWGRSGAVLVGWVEQDDGWREAWGDSEAEGRGSRIHPLDAKCVVGRGGIRAARTRGGVVVGKEGVSGAWVSGGWLEMLAKVNLEIQGYHEDDISPEELRELNSLAESGLSGRPADWGGIAAGGVCGGILQFVRHVGSRERDGVDRGWDGIPASEGGLYTGFVGGEEKSWSGDLRRMCRGDGKVGDGVVLEGHCVGGRVGGVVVGAARKLWDRGVGGAVVCGGGGAGRDADGLGVVGRRGRRWRVRWEDVDCTRLEWENWMDWAKSVCNVDAREGEVSGCGIAGSGIARSVWSDGEKRGKGFGARQCEKEWVMDYTGNMLGKGWGGEGCGGRDWE